MTKQRQETKAEERPKGGKETERKIIASPRLCLEVLRERGKGLCLWAKNESLIPKEMKDDEENLVPAGFDGGAGGGLRSGPGAGGWWANPAMLSGHFGLSELEVNLFFKLRKGWLMAGPNFWRKNEKTDSANYRLSIHGGVVRFGLIRPLTHMLVPLGPPDGVSPPPGLGLVSTLTQP